MRLYAPVRVCLSVTSRCNLSCKHCLNRTTADSEPDLTRHEMLDLIDQLGRDKVFEVNIFGGEPFTSPYLFEYLAALKKHGIKLSLNTNAMLIKRKDVKILKRDYGIRNICVSLDGSSADIMDKMRGRGAFDKASKGIEILVSEGVQVLLSTTITRFNYKDVTNIAMFAKDIGAKGVRFNHVFFAGNADCFMEDVYLGVADEAQALNEIYRLHKEYGNFVSGSYLDQKLKFMKIEKFTPTFDKIKIKPCGAARMRCAIRPDGWVVPCEILWQVKVGNIKQQSLREIWLSSKMESFRKPLIIDLDDMPECKGCKYQYICFHGHRCHPYYYPNGIEDRRLHCWRELSEEAIFC